MSTRRAKREGYPSPLEELRDDAEAIIDDLTHIRDFVRDFAEGKITLEAFLAGPEMLGAEDLEEEEDLFQALVNMVDELQQNYR